MKTVYLDQNKWIDLARLKVSKKTGSDSVYQKILENVEAKKWCVPISVIHLMETIKRADKKSRKDVLDVMTELSKGYSLLSFRDVEEAEVVNAFANYHNKKKIVSFSAIKALPFYALGAIPTLSGCENLPQHVQSELKSILSLCMTNPKLFYNIISFLDSPKIEQSDKEDEKAYLLAMEEERKDILNKPPEFRYKIYLVKNILEIVLKKYYSRISDLFSLTKETFLPPDALSDEKKTQAFLESMPSIDLRVKLNYDLLVDKSYKFQPHDSFDILFLATAVPYCDIVVTERTWVHRIKKLKLNDKYNTTMLSNLDDLRNI